MCQFNIGLRFHHDYLGRRVQKLDHTWSGAAWVAQDDRRFIYRGWQQVAEFWGTYAGGSFVATYSRQVIRGMDLAGPGPARRWHRWRAHGAGRRPILLACV